MTTVGYHTAKIANGQSLSAVVKDLDAGIVMGLQTPADIDSATAITFQGSFDGSTFFNFYDEDGDEVSIVVAGSRTVALDPALFGCLRALKLRLGTASVPVPATAERLIQIAVRKVAGPPY